MRSPSTPAAFRRSEPDLLICKALTARLLRMQHKTRQGTASGVLKLRPITDLVKNPSPFGGASARFPVALSPEVAEHSAA